MATVVIILLAFCSAIVLANPEQGKWTLSLPLDKNNRLLLLAVNKHMYKDSKVVVTASLSCEADDTDEVEVEVIWALFESQCALDFANDFPEDPTLEQHAYAFNDDHPLHYKRGNASCHCGKTPNSCKLEGAVDQIIRRMSNTKDNTTAVRANENAQPETSAISKTGGEQEKSKVRRDAVESSKTTPATSTLAATTTTAKVPQTANQIDHEVLTRSWADGNYLLRLSFIPLSVKKVDKFNGEVTIRMFYGNENYISALDYPLLVFYGILGLVYIIYGLVWLVLLACNWRDLLRVQFWIGGVILLGMMEKAVFFAEYENINKYGISVFGAVFFAEVVSAMKRTLARMLVIIVSLGFGIVKPRLGQAFHKVMAVGVLFFILATIEAYMRTTASKIEMSNQFLLAAVPLAVLDAIICWWIFSGLIQTTRTLRLRRNIVKLTLYRHFTNTLIFAVLASIGYMIWFMTQHRFKDCIVDWQQLWIDEAFWHMLFIVVLLIIMILWRPTANNQRYAFSPLLDAADEEDDEDNLMNDAFDGMKMRGAKSANGIQKQKEQKKNVEDDLKWVEENIPSSVADKALPTLLDSDEELMTTKFEMSKME